MPGTDDSSEIREAATSLLNFAANGRGSSIDTTIVATAAALLERAEGGSGFRVAHKLTDPTLAFVVGTASEAAAPSGRTAELAAIGRRLPPASRPSVLSETEALLARIDPVWAWALCEELLAPQSPKYLHLGRFVAAYGDRRDVNCPGLNDNADAAGPLARELTADRTARQAVSGDCSGIESYALAPLRDTHKRGGLLIAEASSYLVAAAAVEPEWALARADDLLEHHSPSSLGPALELVARAAVAAGLSERVLEFARRSGFITEQAQWTLAATAADALADPCRLVEDLLPRTLDELDPGEELTAALPLFVALAYAGNTDRLFLLAQRWRLPPPSLYTELFRRGMSEIAGPLKSNPAFSMYTTMPPKKWRDVEWVSPGQWPIAAADDPRVEFGLGLLTLLSHYPWNPVPGSLAEVANWDATA